MPIVTLLSENNFSGKTIIPFCTHEGSHFGKSVSDIKTLCPESTFLDGSAIRGRDSKTSGNEISEWLDKVGMLK